MKINFKKFPVYTTINKDAVVQRDIAFIVSNGIYTNVPGIQAHALALKIYNSNDEIELDESETVFLERCMEIFTGVISDSVKDYMAKKKL